MAAPGRIDGDAVRVIERLCSGDSEAWSQFIERYRRLIYSAIHRANGRFGAGWDETAMEEVFEEALFKLLRCNAKALAAWKGRCKLETWIYRIVRNVCVDYMRKSARRGECEEAEEDRFQRRRQPPGISDGARVDLRISLEQAIERVLSPREAIAIRLIYFEGFTYGEIAERLDMTLGAMSGFVYRALGKLRDEGDLGRSLGER